MEQRLLLQQGLRQLLHHLTMGCQHLLGLEQIALQLRTDDGLALQQTCFTVAVSPRHIHAQHAAAAQFLRLLAYQLGRPRDIIVAAGGHSAELQLIGRLA